MKFKILAIITCLFLVSLIGISTNSIGEIEELDIDHYGFDYEVSPEHITCIADSEIAFSIYLKSTRALPTTVSLMSLRIWIDDDTDGWTITDPITGYTTSRDNTGQYLINLEFPMKSDSEMGIVLKIGTPHESKFNGSSLETYVNFRIRNGLSPLTVERSILVAENVSEPDTLDMGISATYTKNQDLDPNEEIVIPMTITNDENRDIWLQLYYDMDVFMEGNFGRTVINGIGDYGVLESDFDGVDDLTELPMHKDDQTYGISDVKDSRGFLVRFEDRLGNRIVGIEVPHHSQAHCNLIIRAPDASESASNEVMDLEIKGVAAHNQDRFVSASLAEVGVTSDRFTQFAFTLDMLIYAIIAVVIVVIVIVILIVTLGKKQIQGTLGKGNKNLKK